MLVLHGDDFVVLGDDDAQQHVEKALRTKYDLRVDRSIGVGETKQEFTVLNRLVSFDERSSTVSYEPDPRHAEIIVKDLGLESAKAVKSPNEKLKAEELDRRAKLHPVEPAEASRYRSLVMRAAFLAQDRPDLSETVKCLARKMQAPTEADFSDLKRLQRYLRGAMRVVQKSQRFSDVLTVHADSDFAGCLLTRKSTYMLLWKAQSPSQKYAAKHCEPFLRRGGVLCPREGCCFGDLPRKNYCAVGASKRSSKFTPTALLR